MRNVNPKMVSYADYKSILTSLTYQELIELLNKIYTEFPEIASTIYSNALSLILPNDVAEITENVIQTLKNLPIDELLSYPRGTSWEYIRRSEAAYDIIERELKPYTSKLDILIGLKRENEARIYLQGVLKEIYHFDQETSTEFKTYLDDHMFEFFESLKEQFLESSYHEGEEN